MSDGFLSKLGAKHTAPATCSRLRRGTDHVTNSTSPRSFTAASTRFVQAS